VPVTPVVLGVLNVTPDSFSDGGEHATTEAAIAHGFALSDAGADIVDVGGESTRPGAQRIPIEEELDRVIPVVLALSQAGISVSIDTMRAEVARRAVAAGASMVNDVSGGQADDAMYATVADLGCDYVVMHWRGHSAVMDDLVVYDDVATDVLTETLTCAHAAHAAGIREESIIIDPGLGFAKTPEQNWVMLRDLERWVGTGRRVLVGASRKKFLGALLADAEGFPRDMRGRDVASAVISGLCARIGVWGVRVHDVRSTRDALAVIDTWDGTP
jgi:dihydropteroate synthase